MSGSLVRVEVVFTGVVVVARVVGCGCSGLLLSGTFVGSDKLLMSTSRPVNLV